jgi:hypothetical protein
MQPVCCAAPAFAVALAIAPFCGAAVTSFGSPESDLQSDARIGGALDNDVLQQIWSPSFDESVSASVASFGSTAQSSAFEQSQISGPLLDASGGTNASATIDAPFVTTADASGQLLFEIVVSEPTVFFFDIALTAAASGLGSADAFWSISFDGSAFAGESVSADEDSGPAALSGERWANFAQAGTYVFSIGSSVSLGDDAAKNGLEPSDAAATWAVTFEIPAPAGVSLLALAGAPALIRRRK